jgi:hypothetical protein
MNEPAYVGHPTTPKDEYMLIGREQGELRAGWARGKTRDWSSTASAWKALPKRERQRWMRRWYLNRHTQEIDQIKAWLTENPDYLYERLLQQGIAP